MKSIRNILTVIGLLTILGGGLLLIKVWPIFSEFDPEFIPVYSEFVTTLLESKDPGIAMMWSVQVEEGISIEDVKESLVSIATERNFLYTGESEFYKAVEAITGEPYRHVSILTFCDAKVGKMMADYRDAYTGFMPCRITVVEDKFGKIWLHSMNLDLMIHGGKELPPELKKEAMRVWKNIKDMMAGAASGDF
ncbi:MAG: DUF302 domain-containing protein [Pseudomonadota bacterium]